MVQELTRPIVLMRKRQSLYGGGSAGEITIT